MGHKKNWTGGRAQSCGKKGNSQQQASQQQQQTSTIKSPKIVPTSNYDNQLNTPCRQIAQLELKPKIKQSKLLSSKSLSQLMPRSLFFKKQKPVQGQSNGIEGAAKTSKLQTTKSFPSGPFGGEAFSAGLQSTMLRNDTPVLLNRIGSASLIGQSSGNLSLTSSHKSDSTLGQPNLSPIAAEEPDRYHDEAFGMTLTISGEHSGSREREEEKEKEDNQSGGSNNNNKYRPLKNTKLVLRDVKNSIGLRMRAKQERQAFVRLTNDETGATPPTKLYSPFNIYTPDQKGNNNNKSTTSSSKTKKKLDLRSIKQQEGTRQGGAENGVPKLETPKQRIAAQHRRHLLQANKFTFDSPAGRLRETVKDVEQFQQCIEDISKAIRARDQSR